MVGTSLALEYGVFTVILFLATGLALVLFGVGFCSALWLVRKGWIVVHDEERHGPLDRFEVTHKGEDGVFWTYTGSPDDRGVVPIAANRESHPPGPHASARRAGGADQT